MKWISCMYVCIPSILDLPPITPLGRNSTHLSSLSYKQVPNGYLFYT